MKKIYSVEEYIEENSHYEEALLILRTIINSTELEETIKWSFPVYTINNKNVISLGAFKNHFSIWFFNGVFLKDEHRLLINAQENKTKGLRHMRFESIEDINKNVVLKYIKEAIENQKLGKEIKPERTKKEVVIPAELKGLFVKNIDIKKAYDVLTPYKQREYCDYINTAKRESTKQKRLNKIIPMILKSTGLNDKYKNC